jgi:hypothetical protein
MHLAQNNDVVQTLTPDRFDRPFGKAVLPGKAGAVGLSRMPMARNRRVTTPAIQLDEEPAIMVREPDATMQPTLQDNQLMSKHRFLTFKPQLRLEWRGQDGQNETEQPDHSASLGDSTTSSTQIRFSVHTGGNYTVLTLGTNIMERHPFFGTSAPRRR